MIAPPSRLAVTALSLCLSPGCFSQPSTEADTEAAGSSSGPAAEASTSGDDAPAATGEDADSTTDSGSTTGSPVEDAGSSSTGEPDLDEDRDGYPASEDCDDTDPAVNPGATEICNRIDDDCDEVVDFAFDVPDDVETIAEAIAMTRKQGTICVGPGTYDESLQIFKALTIESYDGADATVIEPSDGGRAFGVGPDGDAVTIRGFSLTGGTGTWGTSFSANGAQDVLLQDIVVRDNVVVSEDTACGGMIWAANNARITMRDVVLRDNSMQCTWTSGAVHVASGARAALENVIVTATTATVTNGGSAGVSAVGGDLEMRNVVVSNNHVSASDGAAWVSGAVELIGPGSHHIENVTVFGNSADAGTSAASGAGVDLLGTEEGMLEVVVVNTTSTHNTTLGMNTRAAGFSLEGSEFVDYAFFYSNAFGNTPGDFGDEIANPLGLSGNISVDPQFVDTSNVDSGLWNLTLSAGSELIDAGDPKLLDPDKSASDIGAYGGPAAARW